MGWEEVMYETDAGLAALDRLWMVYRMQGELSRAHASMQSGARIVLERARFSRSVTCRIEMDSMMPSPVAAYLRTLARVRGIPRDSFMTNRGFDGEAVVRLLGSPEFVRRRVVIDALPHPVELVEIDGVDLFASHDRLVSRVMSAVCREVAGEARGVTVLSRSPRGDLQCAGDLGGRISGLFAAEYAKAARALIADCLRTRSWILSPAGGRVELATALP